MVWDRVSEEIDVVVCCLAEPRSPLFVKKNCYMLGYCSTWQLASKWCCRNHVDMLLPTQYLWLSYHSDCQTWNSNEEPLSTAAYTVAMAAYVTPFLESPYSKASRELCQRCDDPISFGCVRLYPVSASRANPVIHHSCGQTKITSIYPAIYVQDFCFECSWIGVGLVHIWW
jgi:hypothetical protein